MAGVGGTGDVLAACFVEYVDTFLVPSLMKYSFSHPG